ncbi:uncharacterized protein LOC118514147 isoform X1 [Anopheles stephensi]|nr:uncharacterized protein LOC118514147 isoform X1 [Anopheles stephensi]
MKVEELPEAPVMLVGAYCGYTKPDNIEQYLRPLVTEINELHERGLMFGDKMVHTKLRMFVADSPARCFVNATISFVGKHSCLKCSCVGVHEANKVIFVDVDAELRTDEGFRNRVDREHHKSWR